MKKGMLAVWVIAVGCHTQGEIEPGTSGKPILFPTSTCSSMLKLDKQVTQQEGRVGYREDVGMYYINVYLGGIDSSLTGLVCNMPDALKELNKKVVFDGEYFTDTHLPSPRLGGETIRYLVLTAVK